MSTKALRTIAGMMGCSGVPEKCLHCGATREVEAIERAAKDLDDNLAAQVFASNPEKVVAALDLMAKIAEQTP